MHNSHDAFVAHMNINSIQNKFEELKLFFEGTDTNFVRNQNRPFLSWQPVQTTRIQYVSQRQMQRGRRAHCFFLYIHSLEDIEIAKDL